MLDYKKIGLYLLEKRKNTLYNTDGMKLNLCMESKSNKDL